MATLTEGHIRELLRPFLEDAVVPERLYTQLSTYLDLLLRWNARTNLTAVREPDEIVTRHFGESLFLGRYLPMAKTLLDYGSGAGFPGLPIQLLLPDLQVTLAESQSRKASFLREAVRALGVDTEVWSQRVEAMDPQRRFDIVAARAVDKMQEATLEAFTRLTSDGVLALLTTGGTDGIRIPLAENRIVRMIPRHMFHVEP